ncbi:hypothetical protein [Pseudomonas guariconensis]|uniref:hypothetical protein n=1 Tax=Pseudomonas guariconensis TaxID=1288410 RepID=UPI0018A92638|nr:hypothetical protein [Pseudomonas guariconensis]MBF8721897.1 hypothetical protein [Pseudomonas guariconensis]
MQMSTMKFGPGYQPAEWRQGSLRMVESELLASAPSFKKELTPLQGVAIGLVVLGIIIFLNAISFA